MMDHYFPQDRVILAINQTAMRYAGPREAIFHAFIRQNYDCAHFIVGRAYPRKERMHLVGSQVREMLCRGELPPLEFSRAEVAAELARAMQAQS